MKRITTKTGYVAYEASAVETTMLGGFGICDECSQATERGYLVPVLNHYQCPACFEDWSKSARYYPEDIPIQNKNAAYFESKIPLTKEEAAYEKRL